MKHLLTFLGGLILYKILRWYLKRDKARRDWEKTSQAKDLKLFQEREAEKAVQELLRKDKTNESVRRVEDG